MLCKEAKLKPLPTTYISIIALGYSLIKNKNKFIATLSATNLLYEEVLDENENFAERN